MLPAPRYRTLYVPEDAADGSRLSVPDMPVEAYVDAMNHAVRLSDGPAGDWRCDGCGQKWPGEDGACGYCGRERDD